jgi:hypothetical protein
LLLSREEQVQPKQSSCSSRPEEEKSVSVLVRDLLHLLFLIEFLQAEQERQKNSRLSKRWALACYAATMLLLLPPLLL